MTKETPESKTREAERKTPVKKVDPEKEVEQRLNFVRFMLYAD